MGDITYNFAGIETVAASIASFVSQMNEHLNHVDSTFNNLIANGWTGSAADAFQGCKAKWHSNADAMASTLQTLSQRVGTASVNMAQADAAAAARF
ncbi:MAG: hypothetical protein AUI14_21675 [Actinobacteria bacterium 13_2_20CM_2_71_6]|nr:MAG: hypothetical protein AUI14_21675 [Actinobacteria bacterium 13_2_20CM_2_71_6]